MCVYLIVATKWWIINKILVVCDLDHWSCDLETWLQYFFDQWHIFSNVEAHLHVPFCDDTMKTAALFLGEGGRERRSKQLKINGSCKTDIQLTMCVCQCIVSSGLQQEMLRQFCLMSLEESNLIWPFKIRFIMQNTWCENIFLLNWHTYMDLFFEGKNSFNSVLFEKIN